jgi:addiction module RelE/StbE family toxin
MLRLVWEADALADLRQIIGFIADLDPAAAERLQDAIERIAERLPGHPFLHRPGRVAGTREAIVHPNYILIYRVGADSVVILAVVHARRQYP